MPQRFLDTALLEQLLVMEHKVWRALQVGDAAADRALLSPAFLGVYPSGFSDRAGHAEQLDAGPSVAQYRLSEARVLSLPGECAMLSYRAAYLRQGAEREEHMYVSSLWQRQAEVRDGEKVGVGTARWVNLFSQDTPAEA